MVDGYFGSQTYAQVQRFQSAKKLYVDGEVGAKTWAAIAQAIGAKNGATTSATSTSPTTSSSTTSSTSTTAKPATTTTTTTTTTSSVPNVSGYPYTTIGANNSYVTKLQTWLNQLGYNCGVVDGYFGNQTYTQVRKFQSAKNLYVDGEVGSKTWAAIAQAVGAKSGSTSSAASTSTSSSTTTTKPTTTTTTTSTTPNVSGYPYTTYGASNSYVTKLQTWLNQLGYNCGVVDGYFGSQTYAQVQRFQSAKGLYVDGEVGAKTWAAIAQAVAGK